LIADQESAREALVAKCGENVNIRRLARIESDVVGAYLHGHRIDRKSTRLNSSHVKISYAVFCLKKKNRGVSRPTPGRDEPSDIMFLQGGVLVHALHSSGRSHGELWHVKAVRREGKLAVCQQTIR